MSMDFTDLSSGYDRGTFLEFADSFLPGVERDIRMIADTTAGFSDVVFLGRSPELDLQIFEVKVSGSLDKRVAIAAEAFRLMKNTASFRSLVAFHSPDTEQWRLSLLTAKPTIDEGKVVTRFSSPKRFSYLLGPGSKLGTPGKQLISKGRVTDFEDLSKRFAVEVVNNEFYREISKLYDELVGTDDIAAVIRYPSPKESKQEFGVRLVGRIIFCWFLREKRSASGNSLIPEEILSRQASNESNYYHSILAPLFFEVLNKKLNSREEKFRNNEFASIPYLNGGLFSPGADDYYKFDKVQQRSVSDQIDVPNDWLQRFFDLLEMYNFTVDENTSFDIDLSIDPEMLGRIFENLLARINPETGETVRKGTGSFYTPREIVEYMVDQSLSNYLVQATSLSSHRISALVDYDLASDNKLSYTIGEKQEVLRALSIVKILDPACGSGAFPIGILQKIVLILQRVDPDAKLWLQKQMVGAGPELKRHLEEEFSYQNFDYLRKLGVIRESIYGIDIQPVATEISRLRCFLTLVVDQSVKDDAPNRGIESLPNLDFKFVTANSLIMLPGTSGDSQIGLFEDQVGISDLKALRAEYFGASNAERDELKFRFVQTQNQMFQRMLHTSRYAEMTQKLSAWDPFSHRTTEWFDPEWMFGIDDGFDIIITNPPYLKERDNQIAFAAVNDSPIGKLYHQGKMDFWFYFLHRAMDLSKDMGVISFITSRYWINSSGAKKLISRIEKELSFIDFVDIRKLKVFDNVAGEHMVATYSKQHDASTFTYKILHNDISDISSSTNTENIEISTLQNSDIFSNYEIILEKDLLDYVNTVSLGERFIVTQGVVQNPDKVAPRMAERYDLRSGAGVFVLSEAELKGLDLNKDEMKLVRPFYDENAIRRYQLDGMRRQYILYLTKENCPDISIYPHLQQHLSRFRKIMEARRETLNGSNQWFHLHWPRRAEYFESPKIVMAGMFDSPKAAFVAESGYFGLSTNVITNPDSASLLLLLGILNSKFADYWFTKHGKKRGVGVDVGVDRLRQFPLPKSLKNATESSIQEFVQQIISEGPDEVRMETIDKLVNQLYGFTPNEIAIIGVIAGSE